MLSPEIRKYLFDIVEACRLLEQFRAISVWNPCCELQLN